MRAVICNGFDGPRALRIGEMPEPGVVAGHLLIDVHAASVSFMDCLMVFGKYQMRPATPFAPGSRVSVRTVRSNWYGGMARPRS